MLFNCTCARARLATFSCESFASGKLCRICGNRTLTLAVACAMVTPGFSRPRMYSDSEKFSLYLPQPGGMTPAIDNGAQASGASPTLVPKNSAGATPTMS